MQVNIANYHYLKNRPCFNGKVLESPDLKRYKSSMTESELDTFNKQIKEIESYNDKRVFYMVADDRNNRMNLHQVFMYDKPSEFEILLCSVPQKNPKLLFDMLCGLYKSNKLD